MRNRYGVPAGTIARLRLELSRKAGHSDTSSNTIAKSANPAQESAPTPTEPRQKVAQPGSEGRETEPEAGTLDGAQPYRPKAARLAPDKPILRGEHALPLGLRSQPEGLDLGGGAPTDEQPSGQESKPNSNKGASKASKNGKKANASNWAGLWRSHLCVTQRQAADLLGLSLSAYQTIERGHRFTDGRPVRLDERTRLAMLWHLGHKLGRIPRHLRADLERLLSAPSI
jgi:hypothetical protein